MILINCSPNGLGTIWLPDDASDSDIWRACVLDATERDSNGKQKKEENNGK